MEKENVPATAELPSELGNPEVACEPNREQLIREIRDLMDQYRREVPGHRRRWPESIKMRVRQLRALGLMINEIAEETGLAYFTIIHWFETPPSRRRVARHLPEVGPMAAQFSPVKVTPATVTVAMGRKGELANDGPRQSFTLQLPNGARIEGLTAESLKELFPVIMGLTATKGSRS